MTERIPVRGVLMPQFELICANPECFTIHILQTGSREKAAAISAQQGWTERL